MLKKRSANCGKNLLPYKSNPGGRAKKNLPQDSVLTPDVENAIRHDRRPDVQKSRTVIRLLHPWQNLLEVAKMQAVTTLTVYLWINRYRSIGLEGLIHKPRVGYCSRHTMRTF